MKRRRTTFGTEDDSGFPARSAARSEADLDITPMIDVTFLLLIFFMVTSTLKGTPDLDVPVAEYGTGVATKHATLVRILAPGTGGAAQAVIQIDEPRIADASLDDVRRAVEDGMKANRPQVIIMADREVQNGVVQSVARVVSSIEGAKFHLGVQDRKGGTGDDR